MSDKVNHPDHYTDGGMETIDIIKAKSSTEEFFGFLKGNVIKYVTRAGKKGSAVEDLEKARWYLDKLIILKRNKERAQKSEAVAR